MKPNIIELDERGIFCYEAPEKFRVDDKESEWYKTTGGYMSPFLWNERKLEAAKRDRIYFKDQSNMIHTFVSKGKTIEQGKPYPIPDGYEVKIEKEDEFGNRCFSVFECKCKPYAILVPKEKCTGNCGMNYCDENGCVERKHILCEPVEPKQQSFEEAAMAYKKLLAYDDTVDLNNSSPLTHKGVIHLMMQYKEGQMYFINEDGLYLIPTAEVPIKKTIQRNTYE